MDITSIDAEGVLQQAIALAKSSRNMEIMDRAAILHLYIELVKDDPTNCTYRKDLEYAVDRLQKVVCGYAQCA
jgi:hypothetical protein